ncbi:PhoH family protein, partial [Escherichia coli]|nr:PhoH family protein [Escherichia coli]
GDTEQSDLCYHRYNKENGLNDAMNRLKGVPGIGFVDLDYSSCVREPVVSLIDERYRVKKELPQSPEVKKVTLPEWKSTPEMDKL